MARKNRRNADYFPHPARPGPVEDLVQRRWGNDGYAVYNKTLELLTDAEEHCLDLSGVAQMELYVGYCCAPPDVILQVLNSLANLKFIDPELWQGYRVVWCEQLVNNMLAEVYRKRESGTPKRPETALLTRLRADPAQNSLFPRITGAESKEKESNKEKEILERESRESKNGDGTAVEFYYAARRAGKRRQLGGRSLWWFKIYWECYGYKHNRADAVGAWLDLEWPGGTDNDGLARLVCIGGIREDRNRLDKVDRGLTPIYAQGWLSSNRFEDYLQNYEMALKKHTPKGLDSRLANKVSPEHLNDRPENWK